MKRKSLLFVMVLMSTLAFAKWGQDFISNVGLTNNKGRVGDHFEACIRYQIGWYPQQRSGPINVQTSDVTTPQYALFANSLPAGVTFNSSTGCLSGTPTESGQWQVYPGVRDANHAMYSGNGYWFTQWTTDRSTGLVYATPKDNVAPTITIER